MKQWRCTVCGYIHNGSEPPEKCPVCGADKSKFILVEQASAPTLPDVIPEAIPDPSQSRRWRCRVCGYIFAGEIPPEKCPVCGSARALFVELPEGKESTVQTPSPLAKTPLSESPKPSPNAWLRYPQILTKLHGHPISVHIPNGVLPVAVFFTLLSIVLKSEALAMAAKFNLFFVTLAMPVVLLTGFGDWINRYSGSMSRIFATKMVCGGIVTILCLTLSLWWIFQPDIYLGGLPRLGTFILFHLLALAAAGLAGFYGGRLVFPND